MHGRVFVLCACTASLLAVGPKEARAGEPAVTPESLLREMTDRGALARWPQPAYALRQASSHDRSKTDPADPKTWHSNTDYGNFLRVEENEGRKEWVILDATGPGAVVRFWAPLAPEKNRQTIRFYFDGAARPAVTANFNDLMSGAGFVPPPFAFVSWNDADLRGQRAKPHRGQRSVGGDLYLPIPFAKGCKITLDEVPFYYVINTRGYAPGTAVRTFALADYEKARPTLDRVAEALTADAEPPLKEDGPMVVLKPSERHTLDLPAGERAVRRLQVRIDPAESPQVLRSVVLEGTFDGEPTVWCPLSEFFGAGARLQPVRDWFRSVTKDGRLNAEWVMPYRKTARLALVNAGSRPVRVRLAADARPRPWDERSLLFHAGWRSQREMATRPMSDWNYLDVQGRGVYAGDTLTAFSPVRAWYGEGDERIAVDGETVPAHIGTGTEDYYGYAWGMPNFFNSPWLSTPLRDAAGRDDWRGYTTTSRVRLLDGLPFTKALKLDMEVWNWADTRVDYAVGVFWYARPGARHNRGPQPDEAAAPVRAAPGPVKIAGAVECESLKVVGRSPGLKVGTQDAGLAEGEWSDGRHLFVQATKPGDFLELEVPAAEAGPRRLTVYATRSYDYGVLKFSVNGRAVEPAWDGYSARPVVAPPVDLGVHEPREGKFVLRAEVAGSNPQSRGPRYYFGLDAVRVGKP